jgi:hypothetical protein
VIFFHLPCFSPYRGPLQVCSPSCLVECAPSPKRVQRNGARNMHPRKRRRKTRSARTDRQTRWFWTNRGLLIQQQVWLGMREYDARQPACHYNLHIQPACGGLDYHNYHIRYLGMREDKHVWSVVDAPSGKEKSHRVYAFSKEHFIREVIDEVLSLLVTAMTNDVGDPSRLRQAISRPSLLSCSICIDTIWKRLPGGYHEPAITRLFRANPHSCN